MKTAKHPLLFKRYLIKSKYPNSPFRVGDILTETAHYTPAGKLYPMYHCKRDGKSTKNDLSPKELKDAPLIFEPMDWWANRTKRQMPGYIKSTSVKEFVVKVAAHFVGRRENCFDAKFSGNKLGVNVFAYSEFFVPATQAEYDKAVKKRNLEKQNKSK